MPYLRVLLCSFLLLAGCAGKAVTITSIPAGAQVYRHTDFARNLLGTTPLTSSVSDIMPGWEDDGSDSSITLLFKKQGYQDERLHIREFELPSEISVTLKQK